MLIYMYNWTTGRKDLHKGVDFRNIQVSILLYADDIVLAADEMNIACKTNWIITTIGVTNGVYLSMTRKQTNVNFWPKCVNGADDIEIKNGNIFIETIDHYKHLGLKLNEFLAFESCAAVLSQSGNRAIGALSNKLRNLKTADIKLLPNYMTHVWHLYSIRLLVLGDITNSARLRHFRTGPCATFWVFILLQFWVIWGGP